MSTKNPTDAFKPRNRDARTTDDGSMNWSVFDSYVDYRLDGKMVRYPEDADTVGFRATETRVEHEASFKQTEMLEANIINVDAWFDPDWFYDAPNVIDLGDDSNFVASYNDVEVSFSFIPSELIAAAIQRGNEDAKHPAYVLGEWVYRYRNADHVVAAHGLEDTFANRETIFDDCPGDATAEDARGGFEL
jgi:hypothetical protein